MNRSLFFRNGNGSIVAVNVRLCSQGNRKDVKFLQISWKLKAFLLYWLVTKYL